MGKAHDPDLGVELLWDQIPRAGLSAGRIVRAAIEVADAEGLAGMSMRKVAERLGFTTMSLYRHVPGRDHLVDLMQDAVHAGVTAPDGRTWRARLEACARQGYELRRRHPWLAEIRGGQHVPGPNAVAYYESMLAAVRDTGLTPARMIAVVDLVGRFVDAESLRLLEIKRAEERSGVSHEEWWGRATRSTPASTAFRRSPGCGSRAATTSRRTRSSSAWPACSTASSCLSPESVMKSVTKVDAGCAVSRWSRRSRGGRARTARERVSSAPTAGARRTLARQRQQAEFRLLRSQDQ